MNGIADDRAAPNNGMHPTADTTLLKLINGSGRRVIPGVRLLRLPRRWMK
jgi:hypothetical protein